MEGSLEVFNVNINGSDVSVPSGITVIQACEIAGVFVPRFCYHDLLKIAGNCRMCLVDIKGGPPKLSASCSIPVSDGMVIRTDTDKVAEARKSVMEFLLLNHPLDCPICDQGGECDLQDQAIFYGKPYSRSSEHRRSVSKKEFGPLIKAEMTRCIHCTRCVRFLSDVAGTGELITHGRGENMEIDTYLDQSIHSEMSGNIIDLCPVGALTSYPYEFKSRSWEVSSVETIDVMDAVCSNINVQRKGPEVVRVLPRNNYDINEEWISDKTRFSYDGLSFQRIDSSYIRKEDGRLHPVPYDDAVLYASHLISNAKIFSGVVGNLIDCESMYVFKKLIDSVSGEPLRQDHVSVFHDNRSSYLFNTSISEIESSDVCLIIGSFPRLEAPVINSRLKKRSLSGDFRVASIGPELSHNFKVDCLGDSQDILFSILNGSHYFSDFLKQADRPMIIIGIELLSRTDSLSIIKLCYDLSIKYGVIKECWNGFNVLHRHASSVGSLDIGFKGRVDDFGDVVYLLGADELEKKDFSKSHKIIYQGHHGDFGANIADVVLPGSAYTEKDGLYVNTEGRVQRSFPVVPSPGFQDWKIISDILKKVDNSFSMYNSLNELRFDMFEHFPFLNSLNDLQKNQWKNLDYENVVINKSPIRNKSFDFYIDNSISRSSKNMSKCHHFYLDKSN